MYVQVCSLNENANIKRSIDNNTPSQLLTVFIIVKIRLFYMNKQNDVPYIGLFMPKVFSANSSLELCIKFTRVNFSRNPNESLNLCIFQDFDTCTFANIAENDAHCYHLIYGIYQYI